MKEGCRQSGSFAQGMARKRVAFRDSSPLLAQTRKKVAGNLTCSSPPLPLDLTHPVRPLLFMEHVLWGRYFVFNILFASWSIAFIAEKIKKNQTKICRREKTKNNVRGGWDCQGRGQNKVKRGENNVSSATLWLNKKGRSIFWSVTESKRAIFIRASPSSFLNHREGGRVKVSSATQKATNKCLPDTLFYSCVLGKRIKKKDIERERERGRDTSFFLLLGWKLRFKSMVDSG